MKVQALFAAALAAATVFAAAPAMASYRSQVQIINNSSTTIMSIHSSPTYRKRYGTQDLLGSSMLHSGYYINVDFDSDDAENECWQDIVVEGARGVRWQKTMNICSTSTWTLTD